MQNQPQSRRRRICCHHQRERTRSSSGLYCCHITHAKHLTLHFCKQVPSDADLKEHMVGIIFSRSKLTNLQKQVTPLGLTSQRGILVFQPLKANVFSLQVCAHIVQAIRMEATRVREEWEHAISSKENANSQPSDDDASSDAYCFELLSMVLALSGSNVGRQYLAQQLTLMQDLFSLLHTASPRVQRQVGDDSDS